MTKLLYAASAAAILTVVGFAPAMAQSSTTAPMITCKDITAMDRETARGVVFYLSGFKAASGAQSASSSGTSGTTGSDSSASGSSGSSSSDTTGSTTAAGGASGSSDTSGAAASGSSTGASGGASSMVTAQLPGFSGVDVDKIMTECASSPGKQLSDMMGSSK